MKNQLSTLIQEITSKNIELLTASCPVYERFKIATHSVSFKGATLNLHGFSYRVGQVGININMHVATSQAFVGTHSELIDHKTDTHKDANLNDYITYDLIALLRLEILLKWVDDNPNLNFATFNGISTYLQNGYHKKF